MRAAWMVMALAGCGDNHHFNDHLAPYFDWNGQHTVGSVSIDPFAADDPSLLGLIPGHPGSVVMLYGHAPGSSVSVDTIEAVLAGAQAAGMPFLTYTDLAAGGDTRTGLCLSFDDNSFDAWFGIRDLLTRYDARVTFFITEYDEATPAERAELHALADDGHDIEAHTMRHLHGIDYVDENGLEAYLQDEVIPSLDILVADGFPRPVAFAYPYGERTDEMDAAILEHVSIVRGISGSER